MTSVSQVIPVKGIHFRPATCLKAAVFRRLFAFVAKIYLLAWSWWMMANFADNFASPFLPFFLNQDMPAYDQIFGTVENYDKLTIDYLQVRKHSLWPNCPKE